MKAMSLCFSQRDVHKMHHENGITEQEPASQPVSNYTTLMDMNGAVKLEPDSQPDSDHAISMNSRTYMKCLDSCDISKDDLQKIQVLKDLLFIHYFFHPGEEALISIIH